LTDKAAIAGDHREVLHWNCHFEEHLKQSNTYQYIPMQVDSTKYNKIYDEIMCKQLDTQIHQW